MHVMYYFNFIGQVYSLIILTYLPMKKDIHMILENLTLSKRFYWPFPINKEYILIFLAIHSPYSPNMNFIWLFLGACINQQQHNLWILTILILIVKVSFYLYLFSGMWFWQFYIISHQYNFHQINTLKEKKIQNSFIFYYLIKGKRQEKQAALRQHTSSPACFISYFFHDFSYVISN